MKKRIYDEVGITSVLLKEKIIELDNCQKEKQEILNWIDQLKASNTLKENAKEVREKMANNLKKFKKVVAEIENIKNSIQ